MDRVYKVVLNCLYLALSILTYAVPAAAASQGGSGIGPYGPVVVSPVGKEAFYNPIVASAPSYRIANCFCVQTGTSQEFAISYLSDQRRPICLGFRGIVLANGGELPPNLFSYYCAPPYKSASISFDPSLHDQWIKLTPQLDGVADSSGAAFIFLTGPSSPIWPADSILPGPYPPFVGGYVPRVVIANNPSGFLLRYFRIATTKPPFDPSMEPMQLDFLGDNEVQPEVPNIPVDKFPVDVHVTVQPGGQGVVVAKDHRNGKIKTAVQVPPEGQGGQSGGYLPIVSIPLTSGQANGGTYYQQYQGFNVPVTVQLTQITQQITYPVRIKITYQGTNVFQPVDVYHEFQAGETSHQFLVGIQTTAPLGYNTITVQDIDWLSGFDQNYTIKVMQYQYSG